MNLSNYTFETCLEQWLENCTNNVELLRRAIELRGLDEVRAFLAGRGLVPHTITAALRAIGALPPAPPRRAPTPLEILARTLRRDLPKLTPEERAVVAQIWITYEKEHPVVHVS